MAIVEILEAGGLRCWIAPRDVTPGAPYARELVDAVASARAVLVLFTRAANDSDAVLNELELAFNRHIPIIPVRFDAIEPAGSAEFYLRRRHWFDIHDDLEVHRDRLVRAVREVTDAALPPRPARRRKRTAKSPVARSFLVGREAELALIAEAIDKTKSGHGTLLLVRGDPGIGKTAILSAAVERAQDAGFTTASTINFEHTQTPLGPWIDLLRAVEVVVPAVVPSESADRAAYHELLGLREHDAKGPRSDGRRLFVIIVEAIQRAARQSPLALALDDIQWADPETIELLDFAIPRLSQSPVLLLLGQRTGSMSAPALALSSLERYPSVRVVDLRGISTAAVRQLIASTPSTEGELKNATIDEICSRSDGNPLFAAELVRAARTLQPGRELLPTSVQLSVVARLRALKPDEARIIETAAALGRTFSLDDLHAIDASDRPAIATALRSARDADLIEQSATNAQALSFRHELFRAAAYEELLPFERTEIHRAIAQRLTARNSMESALLAYHWQRAGDLEQACLFAIRAGDEATLINAYASARDDYARALETNVLSGTALAQLHEKFAISCDALGDAAGAARYFGLAATFYRSIDADEANRLELRVAGNAYRTGRGSEVVSSCERVLSESSRPSLLYGANAILASYYANRGDSDKAWSYIRAADSLGVEGDVRDRLSVEWARAVVHEGSDAEAALDAARTAVRIAEDRGTQPLFALNLMNLSIVSAAQGRDDVAVDAIRRSITIADANGVTYTSAYARCVQARALYFRGELREAHHSIAQAIGLHVDALIVRFYVAGVGLDILADLGSLDDFPALRDPELLEAAFASGEEGRFAPLAAAHAHAVALSEGDRAAAAIVKRAVSSVQRLSAAPLAWVTLARYGATGEVLAMGELLPADSPPGPQLLGLRLLQAIVARRSGASDAMERANIAFEQTRAVHTPLLGACRS